MRGEGGGGGEEGWIASLLTQSKREKGICQVFARKFYDLLCGFIYYQTGIEFSRKFKFSAAD